MWEGTYRGAWEGKVERGKIKRGRGKGWHGKVQCKCGKVRESVGNREGAWEAR